MTHVFIESGKRGTNEYNFIKTLIERECGKACGRDYEIVTTNGYTNLGKQAFLNLFDDHDQPEERDIVIFDADYEATGGGFAERWNHIDALRRAHGVRFELFLFPNNRDDGMFETLLQQLVNPKYARLLDYFKDYEKSVADFSKQFADDPFETPDEKARIYSYISAFRRSNTQREKFKGGEWDFANAKYWTLSADYLSPLRDFLKAAMP